MEATLSFMTSDEIYQANIPAEVTPHPRGSAAWAYEGDRLIVYVPSVQFDREANYGEFDGVFTVDAGGTLVEVFRRREEPSLLSAIWNLPGGVVQTFVDSAIPTEEDMRLVIQSVQIAHPEGRAVPRLTFLDPLTVADRTGIETLDSLSFGPSDSAQSWPLIEITKVPEDLYAVEDGSSRTLTDETAVTVIRGSGEHLAVACKGPHVEALDVKKFAADVAASIERVG